LQRSFGKAKKPLLLAPFPQIALDDRPVAFRDL